ncbi:MAG: hypothetical protein ABSC15_20255 [Terriglobales bacterium]|jgi:hypothetical protein
MHTATSSSDSDLVRLHASDEYIAAARRRGDKTVSIHVGTVHKALALNNRIPLVCAALGSKKFLTANGLRLVSKTGPPSGQSTTVTYTYEFVDKEHDDKGADRQDAWNRLRGALKDVFAELGGGENYLRSERANFYGPGKDR